MALIKCPECGKEISDKSEICIGCGFPLRDYVRKVEKINEPYTICSACGKKNPIGIFKCQSCGHKYTMKEYDVIEPEENWEGIYRYSFGRKTRVYCPRCGSEKCSNYQEQKIIPGKVKTKYTANLNPFKPFTLINKNEKVLRKEEIVTESKFVCNNCGKIFK